MKEDPVSRFVLQNWAARIRKFESGKASLEAAKMRAHEQTNQLTVALEIKEKDAQLAKLKEKMTPSVWSAAS